MPISGAVVLVRHGDRQGFYQDETSYTPTGTAITPLGNQQEYQLGQLLRSMYLNSTSETNISGMNASVVNLEQVQVRADAGGEGGVIFNSAISLLQGLFPADSGYVTVLANGTRIEGPLNGYQYIPVESVEPDNDVSLEGWTSCATFADATEAFYNSAEFKQKEKENEEFFNQLPLYLDGRPVSLKNMWNIFDFMNVQNIHNERFADAVPEELMRRSRDLANYHEYGVFTSPSLDGIGNIAGRAMVPSLLESMQRIADKSDDLMFSYHAISYKPFLSLFNMTGVNEANPELAAIVDYAGSMILEIYEDDRKEPAVRFKFKNGTNDDTFETYNYMRSTNDVALSTLVEYLTPAGINSTQEWCDLCGNSEDRGCNALTVAEQSGRSQAAIHQPIGPVGAGFLGAGLALAVSMAMVAVLLFMGFLQFGRGKRMRAAEKA